MLITTRQYKLNKSISRGWTTAGLNLSPANEAALVTGRRLPTMCAMAGTCAKVCLKYTGFNQMMTHQPARVARTLQLLDHRDATIKQLVGEIRRQAQKAPEGRFAFRPNLLSDQPTLAHALASELPQVQFYDYTKLPKPWTRTRPNYHLTFSYSERSTWREALECLDHGINVAIVLDIPRDAPMPDEVRGIQTVDGDADDLRFLDPTPRLVGLRFKGGATARALARAQGFLVTV